ncbi:glycosyltransferase [Pantoea sp. LMR881]|uniref:glycosyltransferase n=1 Tax=Pantoea sp. LMR881 TaxID=3014336 RepID=UPI0022AE861B|nr:glycosyltransferase [Pantoea sp. LMR881]MCZ4060745.1 glycosyltransferase [Pantoea sp. LMR881]
MKTSDFGTVSILLGTYNGELYIQRQLDSIRAQTYQNWVLYVSDDGSVDRTLEIIKSFARELPPGKVNILQGPHKGFAQNFLHLLKNKSIQSPYYAFCDQDDIWLEDKLERALNIANDAKRDNQTELLYGGRTELIDENELPLGYSPQFKKRIFIQKCPNTKLCWR